MSWISFPNQPYTAVLPSNIPPPSSTNSMPVYNLQDPSFQYLYFQTQYLENLFLFRQHSSPLHIRQLPAKSEPILEYSSQNTLLKEEPSSNSKIEYSDLKIEEKMIPKQEESESENEDEEDNDEEEGCKKEEFDLIDWKVGLNSQLLSILSFFIKKFGKINEEEMLFYRSQYPSHQMRELFDALKSKFTAATKCREDMRRFIVRKALTWTRDSIKQKNQTAKAASLVLCQRYFDAQVDGLENGESRTEREKQLLSFLLPYKKNSRNKTANTNFIIEIFTSQVFYQDYLKFIEKLGCILTLENQKKIKKFIVFLMNCLRDNKIHKVKEFKRLPWVESWNESTLIVAYELLDARKWKEYNKKPKVSRKKQKRKSENLIKKEEELQNRKVEN